MHDVEDKVIPLSFIIQDRYKVLGSYTIMNISISLTPPEKKETILKAAVNQD